MSGLMESPEFWVAVKIAGVLLGAHLGMWLTKREKP